MKKLLAIIGVTFVLLSCKKESARPSNETPSYIGTYLSVSNDTLYVSDNGDYARFRLCRKGIEKKYQVQFDSIVVKPDLTFTENEIVNWYGMGVYRNIGNGSFVDNKVKFTFLFGGYIDISYEGYKQ